jgi:hypothetical protein
LKVLWSPVRVRVGIGGFDGVAGVIRVGVGFVVLKLLPRWPESGVVVLTVLDGRSRGYASK